MPIWWSRCAAGRGTAYTHQHVLILLLSGLSAMQVSFSIATQSPQINAETQNQFISN